MPAIAARTDLPLRLGHPEDFSRVRNFFRAALFDEANVCRVLALESMSDFGRVKWEKIPLDTFPAPLRWCLQVLMRGLGAGRAESQLICGGQTFASFGALGLLRPSRKDEQSVVCPVWAYPCDGWVVVSDRANDPDGEPYQPDEDVVFPAIYGGTLRFLKLLPEARNGEALDLCGGSGIGALHLSRTARTAATADVTERSARFADFNGRLNGIPLESACGNLYEPVAGRKFDVISAHPPFVPAVGPNMVYRDGGETGEEITRQIVAGLPAHLKPGGTCVILCVARDTREKPFEQRARDWLGGQQGEFDIVFGYEKILSVKDVVDSIRRGGKNLDEAQAGQLAERLYSLDTRQFAYGALFLRRFTGGGASEPLRLQLRSQGRAADFERVLQWRAFVREPDPVERLAGLQPALVRDLELTIRHVMKEGELVPAEFIFSIEAGFQAALRPDGWLVPLVARLNGTKTVRHVFEAAQAADELPAGFTLKAFTDLIGYMIERGFLDPGKI
jgi:hypothetical protein